MQAAGKMEHELAIKQGSFHQGVPVTTVIVDAEWSKREHINNYILMLYITIQANKIYYIMHC